MDWRTVGSWAIKWQLLNQVATHAIAYHASDGKANENILRFGPNYLVSTIHAIRASIRGLEHLWTLIRCPDKEKMWLNEEKKEKELVTEGYREGIRVMHTNYAFLGYLLQDLVHVLMQYPELGGIDVIIHHVLFAATSVIAGTYKVFVFPFAWLILGEMSTPLLNLRWFLTETGKSDTKLYQGATYSFAIVFTLSRIVGYVSFSFLYRNI